jgi:hypothetical protein
MRWIKSCTQLEICFDLANAHPQTCRRRLFRRVAARLHRIWERLGGRSVCTALRITAMCGGVSFERFYVKRSHTLTGSTATVRLDFLRRVWAAENFHVVPGARACCHMRQYNDPTATLSSWVDTSIMKTLHRDRVITKWPQRLCDWRRRQKPNAILLTKRIDIPGAAGGIPNLCSPARSVVTKFITSSP